MALTRRWARTYDRAVACEFPPVAQSLNRLLLALVGVDRRLIRHWSRPFGTSAYALAERVE